MFAFAPARHAFVAPVLGHREPTQRQAQAACLGDHHTGDGGRHLGAQGQMPVVELEMVELIHDLFARFARKELRVLQHRGIDFLERIAMGHRPEVVEKPRSSTKIIRIEVPHATRRLQGAFAHRILLQLINGTGVFRTLFARTLGKNGTRMISTGSAPPGS